MERQVLMSDSVEVNDIEVASHQNESAMTQSGIPQNFFLSLVDMEVQMTSSNYDLCQTVARANNLLAVQVPGNSGDCQYLSVIECLKAANYVELQTVGTLRRRVAEEILSDPSRYEPFLSNNEGSISIESFAQSVKYQEWGCALTLHAIANTLNIHLTVYQFSCSSQSIYEVGDAGSDYHIFLTLDNRQDLTAHYGGLIACSNRQLCCERERLGASFVDVDRRGKPSYTGYRCSICNQGFGKKRGLSMHMLIKHRENIEHMESCSNVESEAVSEQSSIVDSLPTKINTRSQMNSESCETASRKSKRRGISKNKVASSGKSVESDYNVAASSENNQCGTSTGCSGSSHSEMETNGRPSRCGTSRKERLTKNAQERLKEIKKKYQRLYSRANKQVDPLYEKLKRYHDCLLETIDNVTTQKLPSEVLDVLADPSKVDDVECTFAWSKEDEVRLNKLNEDTKKLQMRDDWYWRSDKNSIYREHNEERMQFCVDNEFVEKIIHCPQCKSTGLLVGLDQIDSSLCYDCVKLNALRSEKEKTEMNMAWEKVRPTESYPKRTEEGFEHEDLPFLSPAERAAIAPVHPIVTVTKNSYSNKKLRQESISLEQDPVPTWCKILPRRSLKQRFMVIESTSKKSGKRHGIVNPERVAQWLRYLFKNHKTFIEKQDNLEMELSLEAIQGLESSEELAEILEDFEDETDETGVGQGEGEDGVVQACMQSGLSRTDVFAFDKYPHLYLKAQEFLKIKRAGKIEIIENPSERRPTYNSSANIAFVHLYPEGQSSALDFHNHKLAKYLLKKQTLFAHKMSDGRRVWNFGADDFHMAHQFARLQEQTIHAKIGYYLSEHPDIQHLPIDSVIQAFKAGPDDQGLLDSHLPDLSMMMTSMPNSKQRWFSERMAIESISKDLGEPNLFLTVNCDARAWPDVRRLLHKLETGNEKVEAKDVPFELNTEKFTALMSKYAPQLAIYLYRKIKIFLDVFLHEVCRVESMQKSGQDWTNKDRTSQSWAWRRAEFTESRGIQHWHCLVKLPNVLDTSILGRLVNSGRVVRSAIKRGNIVPGKEEQAWEIVEMGLLASRYLTLFADSITTSAFYSEEMDVGTHDASKVVDLEQIRNEYVQQYKAGNVTPQTHPIMRKYNDEQCDSNEYIEMARVAAVSCMHHCIKNCCGGDDKQSSSGSKKSTCRFQFPRPLLKHSVCAVMSLSSEQSETRLLNKRTCDRTPNLNTYFLKYFRANHDATVLVDAGHKMRYATKYASKSENSEELINEFIDFLNKRSNDILPPNLKQVLSHLVLADCAHKSFQGIQEIAYKVMNLPFVRRSFADVGVVGFYRRANLTQSKQNDDLIFYSDRTEYSAYSERCRDNTVIEVSKRDKHVLTKEELAAMNLREFAETINHRWVDDKVQETIINTGQPKKLRSRDVTGGHWVLKRNNTRRHIRWSTVLYTQPACQYEPIEFGKTTSQLNYFDLPTEKRKQLYRGYQELVCYVPWTGSPDESFLSPEVRQSLEEELLDSERDQRYNLRRLEEFFKVYDDMYRRGEVAPPGSQWHRDNQFSYSMYLASKHNRDVRLDQIENKGVLKATYEPAEELADVDVEIRPEIIDEVDESEFPSVLNYLPPDDFKEITNQEKPKLSEISVAFPMQHNWQLIEELVMVNKSKLFMADPPQCPVGEQDMTPIQQFAVERGVDPKQQILFVCGQAGSGKTTVALKICETFAGRVQAGAGTGKAASIFNGPTTHSMFGWSHNEFQEAQASTSHNRKMGRLRTFYENTDVFVIDEAMAMSASSLALLDETMTQVFQPNLKAGNKGVRPFGSKKIIFLGDAAQLRPVTGAAIYDEKSLTASINGPSTRSRKAASLYNTRTLRGQELYRKYLLPNAVILQQGKRNNGLLQEICTRLRNGEQTAEDLNMLTHMRRNFPDVVTQSGIHYDNESCTWNNLHELWSDCKKEGKRLYVCKASYHMTLSNHTIVEGLSSIPANKYNFAPDLLCVAEGAEIRLIRNLNVSAGLVNSCTGYVVKVLFNNADVPALVEGRNPPAYALIVDFPCFQGFISQDQSERIRPIPQHPQWVPIFREKFFPSSVPTWIRKKQSHGECYRQQFPIDLCRHITAHRAQGQTLSNRTVMVDLKLSNPDSSTPADVASILYVACTRVNNLRDLFVSPIFPSVWEKLGKSDRDEHRKVAECKLRKATMEFASRHGKYVEMKNELAWTPDVSHNPREWKEIKSLTSVPVPAAGLKSYPDVADESLRITNGEFDVPLHMKPVRRERHIGIDQGKKNFAIAVVDKVIDGLPTVVAAEKQDLQLQQNFTVSDVLLALRERTNLMAWMQPAASSLPEVDRVIVHIEQMSLENPLAKKFSIELGKLLQRQAGDVDACVVKLSQPHVHRAAGPMFKMGRKIVDTLNLTAATYQQVKGKRKRPVANDDTAAVKRRRPTSSSSSECDDVEPDSDGPLNSEYRKKKKMSAALFKYFIEADESQQEDLNINISADFQSTWKNNIAAQLNMKLDDLGDALLHALNDILCGGSKYKQLAPAASSLNTNRTVAIAVYPTQTFWAVIHCTWNSFLLENFGFYNSKLMGCYYKDPRTVELIQNELDEQLLLAVTKMGGEPTYTGVEHIKIVVKQLSRNEEHNLTRLESGALTNATVQAMRSICDKSCSAQSLTSDIHDRLLGTIYTRTDPSSGVKYQVLRSAGKHTNAILACLEWMRGNVESFVESRRNSMTSDEKLLFFKALEQLATLGENGRLEMLRLSELVKDKFRTLELDDSVRRLIADLILVAVNRNQQHVKSIAANYRKVPCRSAETVEAKRNKKPSQTSSVPANVPVHTDVEPMEDNVVCTCTRGDRTSCNATRHVMLKLSSTLLLG